MKTINRYFSDTEIIKIAVNIECPYCGEKWLEEDKDECGETYLIKCNECLKYFKMYFDAN